MVPLELLSVLNKARHVPLPSDESHDELGRPDAHDDDDDDNNEGSEPTSRSPKQDESYHKNECGDDNPDDDDDDASYRVTDQLPVVEEYKTSAAIAAEQEEEEDKKRRRRRKRRERHKRQYKNKMAFSSSWGSSRDLMRLGRHLTVFAFLVVVAGTVLAVVYWYTVQPWSLDQHDNDSLLSSLRHKRNRDFHSPLANNTNSTIESEQPMEIVTNSEVEPTRSSELLRFDEFVEFVKDQGWSSPSDLDKANKGPQWDACVWFAEFDRQNLDFRDPALRQVVRQRYAVAVFFFALNGRHWERYTGWISGADVCEWWVVTANAQSEQIKIGIDCQCPSPLEDVTGVSDCDDSTIKRIILPSMRLSGSIPSEIRLLADLVELDLNHNGIEGVATELGALPKLKTVALHSNDLTGDLTWIYNCSRTLKTLNVADNRLTFGSLELQSLTNLEILSISHNQFSPERNQVSQVFRGLRNLRVLLASGCGLAGSLTEDDWLMSGLPQLQVLDLAYNDIHSGLPPTLFHHENLAVLDLRRNRLHGSIPNDIPVDGSSSLRYISLQGNELAGHFPSTLGNAEYLYHVDCANNFLSGPFPTFKNKTLRHIDLSFNNQFDAGPIPSNLGDFSGLEYLALQQTNRQGSFGGIDMSNWAKLRTLDLGDNALTGEIPRALSAATELQRVILYRNKLTGNFADVMKRFHKLKTLVVHDNNWTQGVKVEALCLPHMEFFTMDHCVRSQTITSENNMSTASYCPCCECCSVGAKTCRQDTHYAGDSENVWDTEYVRQHYRKAENDLTKVALSPLLSTGGDVSTEESGGEDGGAIRDLRRR